MPLHVRARMSGMKRVLMTDELFQQLGADHVEWGEPDADGFYAPNVYAALSSATPDLRVALERLVDKRTLAGDEPGDGYWVSLREMRYAEAALSASRPARISRGGHIEKAEEARLGDMAGLHRVDGGARPDNGSRDRDDRDEVAAARAEDPKP